MSIRYKIAVVFTGIVLISSVPVSMYIMQVLKTEKIDAVIEQGRDFSEVSAEMALKIVIMNGADIAASRIDAREMFSMFEPLLEGELVYADTFLISPNPRLNGVKISEIRSETLPEGFKDEKVLSPEELDAAKASAVMNWRNIEFEEIDGLFYETAFINTIPGIETASIGRMIFSHEKLIQPVNTFMNRIYTVITILVLLIIGAAFYTGRLLIRPVEKLTEGVKKIEEGDFSATIDLKGKDEIALLATSFNRMSSIVNQKMTELETLNIELQKLDKIKDEFLANTSHELKTPLHGIIGISESLIAAFSSENHKNSEYTKELQLITESARRLSNLVNDILDFSRMRNRDLNLIRKPLDISASASFICSIIRHTAGNKPVEIFNLVEDELPLVFADEERIHQVLFNLMGNSLKFTDKGNITINADVKYDYMHISIADTGIGIPSNKIADIFNPFEQADGTTTRRYGGTGLGLAITKYIVEMHEGEITVKSSPDKGSLFIFTLPLFDPAVHMSEGIEPYEIDPKINHLPQNEDPINLFADDKSGKYIETAEGKILVVDDEPLNLKVASSILTREGFSVVTASGAEEALEYLKPDSLPDLILLDIMMPGMNGYELCEHIRNDQKLYTLPVIMLTAKNMQEDIILSYKAGANDFIAKPVDREVLISRVKNLISLKNAAEHQARLNIIQEELSIANTIQRSILPSKMPEIEGLKVNAYYRPANEIGGDFYDFTVKSEKELGLMIADVTGHGVPAALVASMLKLAFSQNTAMIKTPARLLNSINSALSETHSGQFVTAQCAYINSETNKLIFSSAGHWPGILINRNTGNIKSLYVKGIPLCMVQDIEYDQIELDTEPGDRLILYTDGILESSDTDGKIFGEERLHQLTAFLKDQPGESFIEKAVKHTLEWSDLEEGDSFEDDLCIICVDID